MQAHCENLKEYMSGRANIFLQFHYRRQNLHTKVSPGTSGVHLSMVARTRVASPLPSADFVKIRKSNAITLTLLRKSQLPHFTFLTPQVCHASQCSEGSHRPSHPSKRPCHENAIRTRYVFVQQHFPGKPQNFSCADIEYNGN